MDSRPQIVEPVSLFRTLTAPVLSFSAILLVLLAPLNSIALLTSSGSYAPLVSLLLNGIRLSLLPPGWHMIIISPNEPTEIYVVASLTLTLLLSSPLISYQLMRLIAPVLAIRKRTLYSLVVVASMLLAAGAIFGFFVLVKFYLAAVTPFSDFVSIPPVVDAAGFYFDVFGVVGATAVAFTLPVYIYALIRYRRK